MKNKYLIFLLFLFSFFVLFAQKDSSRHTNIKGYILGGNNATFGNYMKLNTLATFVQKKWSLESGIGISHFTDDKIYFDAFLLQGSYFFNIKKQLFSASALYVMNPYFKENIFENNYAFKITYILPHFTLEIGPHIRMLSPFNNQDYSGSSLFEFNFIYNFTAYIFQKHKNYNVHLSVTNVEPFELERFTMPSFVVGNQYVYKSLTFMLEARFTPAGLTNIHVNYYDLQLKGGLSWKF